MRIEQPGIGDLGEIVIGVVCINRGCIGSGTGTLIILNRQIQPIQLVIIGMRDKATCISDIGTIAVRIIGIAGRVTVKRPVLSPVDQAC